MQNQKGTYRSKNAQNVRQDDVLSDGLSFIDEIALFDDGGEPEAAQEARKASNGHALGVFAAELYDAAVQDMGKGGSRMRSFDITPEQRAAQGLPPFSGSAYRTATRVITIVVGWLDWQDGNAYRAHYKQGVAEDPFLIMGLVNLFYADSDRFGDVAGQIKDAWLPAMDALAFDGVTRTLTIDEVLADALDEGLTVEEIATSLYGVAKPTKNQRDSVRVRLGRMTGSKVARQGDKYVRIG